MSPCRPILPPPHPPPAGNPADGKPEGTQTDKVASLVTRGWVLGLSLAMSIYQLYDLVREISHC